MSKKASWRPQGHQRWRLPTFEIRADLVEAGDVFAVVSE
jgi:hypothetical protein